MWREPSAGGLCWCRGSGGGKQRVRAGPAHTAGLLRPISFLRRGLAGKVAQLCAVGSVQLVPSAVARPAPGVTSRPRPVRAVAARLRFCPATACASAAGGCGRTPHPLSQRNAGYHCSSLQAAVSDGNRIAPTTHFSEHRSSQHFHTLFVQPKKTSDSERTKGVNPVSTELSEPSVHFAAENKSKCPQIPSAKTELR